MALCAAVDVLENAAVPIEPGGGLPPHHVLPDEADALSAVLGAAFAADPVFTWMCPHLDVDARGSALQGFFAPVLAMARQRGHAYATDNGMAAALWSPPGVELYDGPELEQLGAFFVNVLGDRAEVVSGALQALEERHPREPHFYLAVLGTHPAMQGHGLGRDAVGPVLERCDATGLPAYLESSSIRNVPFYERLGFRTTESVELPDGPEMYLMWREPQPRSDGGS